MRLPWLIAAGTALAAVPLLLLAAPGPSLACPLQDETGFAGSKSCQKCHFKEYASWQKTKMAQAMKALKPNEVADAKKKAGLDPAKDYSHDQKCLACHTTGYGKKGGYPVVVEGKEWTAEEKERSALMENAGCECCHGPGEKYAPYKKDNKEYKWADIAKLGAVHPEEKGCVECHNKNSPSFKEFKFDEAVGHDTHELAPLKKDHCCPHKHRDK